MNVYKRIDRISNFVDNCNGENYTLGFLDSFKRKASFNLLKAVKKSDLQESSILASLDKKTNVESLRKLAQRTEKKILGIEIRYNNMLATTQLQGETFELYQKLVFIMALRETNESELFEFYAPNLLQQSLKTQSNEITLIIADQLVYIYSFLSFDSKKADKYKAIYNQSILNLEMKNNISRLYFLLANAIVTEKSRLSAVELDRFENDILEYKHQIGSQHSIIADRYFSSLYFVYLLKMSINRMISTCQDGLLFFNDRFPKKISFRYIMTLRLGVAYLYLGDFKTARNHINTCLGMNPTPGMLHWNSTYSYYFTLEMLTKNYQAAADILVKIATTKEINKLDDMWLQQWRIRSAYIHFLAKIDYVDLMVLGRRRVPNFKLGKFLNDVPLYAKDKRGLNISILIAQVLILLADKKWDKIYDRMESLSQYSYRHFKNDSAVRSNCFIRMLLSLAKADFNPKRAQRYAQKYVDRLSTTEMNLNEYSTEIEIIPYEDLWQIILGLTEGKKHIRKRPK